MRGVCECSAGMACADVVTHAGSQSLLTTLLTSAHLPVSSGWILRILGSGCRKRSLRRPNLDVCCVLLRTYLMCGAAY